MQRVLVTGATGLVGSHTVEQLVKRGYQVYGTVRESSDTKFLNKLGAHLRYGDLNEPSSLIEATKGMDAVVHTAAKVGDWGSRREFYSLNVEATEALLNGALDNGIARFIHISSVAVYGRKEHRTIAEDETSRPIGHPYIDTKIAAENRVMTYYEKGLATSIIRPCTIYGKRDRNFLPRICKNIKRGRMFIVGSGKQLANIVYVENVVDLLMLLLENEAAVGEAFNCVDKGLMTWNEVINCIAELVGAREPKLHIPHFIAYDLGLLLETVGKLTGRVEPPLITRFAARLLGGRFSYDISKAGKLLGYRPKFSTEEGLRRSV